MLRPTKHAHPDKTAVYASMKILERLKKQRVEGVDDLATLVKKAIPGGIPLFVPALDLLFLLGLVEYLPQSDSIEYVGKS